MKRLAAGVLAGLFLVLMCSSVLLAAPGIRVSINGQERTMDPAPRIVDDRVMVPLRFVVEDPALQSQVEWDGRQKRATVSCQGQRFDFDIGKKTVYVNGAGLPIDVAPCIYRERTFIPVRFLAEHLGAVVGWVPRSYMVTLDFQSEPIVFAYYYGDGFSELQQRANLLTDVAFRWYQTDERGQLSYEYSDARYQHKFGEVAAWAKKQGLKTHASVMLFNREQLSVLLNSPSNRKHLITNLKKVVKEHNFDGVNIDFEMIAPEDKDSFTGFLKELKAGLGWDKTVSVAVFARTGKENWPTPYDYKSLGQVCDLVVIMAYDYSYNQAGPVAPLDWCGQVVDYAVKNIPRSRIVMGMGTYGYDWVGQQRKSVNQARLNQLQQEYMAQGYYDEKSSSPCLIYIDGDEQVHQVWYENRTSLGAKWRLYQEKGVGGVSFWKISGAFTDFYGLLQTELKK